MKPMSLLFEWNILDETQDCAKGCSLHIYSTDSLALCNLFLFPKLKIPDVDGIKCNMRVQFHTIPKEEFQVLHLMENSLE